MAIIDVVKWQPQQNQTIFAHKFSEGKDACNLSTYTQLIVQESQEAVLFSKGQVMGKFGPGKHTLNTENLPILRSLYGLPFGGKNPFTAEVWFVNKVQVYNIDWCIDRMDIHDVDYNTGIPLVARGRYGLKITDTERFLIKIVGTKNNFDENDLTDQFVGEFSSKTKSVLSQFMMKNKIGLKQISAHLDEISEYLRLVMVPFWENIGLELSKFYVTSIEVDSSNEAGRKILEAISQQSAQAIGGYTWQQSRVFETAKEAVSGSNGSGLIGAVIASNIMGGSGSGIMQPQYTQPTFTPNSTEIPGNVSQPVMPGHEVYCSNCSKKFSSSLKFCPSCGDEYIPCPKCGTDNGKEAKRCVSCGQQLIKEQGVCPNCNSAVIAGNAFCGSCGKALSEDTCTRCGAKLLSTTKFCPGCGQKKP